MMVWLDTHGIRYPEVSTKVELFQLIKNKQTHISVVLKHSLLERYGHVALRFPPYHPELYPIEKMWAMDKTWVAMKNVTFQLQDVRKLTEEKFSSITKDEWLPVYKRVQEVEEKYIKNEHLVDNIAEDLVIILESSYSDMSEEDEDNTLEGILPFSPHSHSLSLSLYIYIYIYTCVCVISKMNTRSLGGGGIVYFQAVQGSGHDGILWHPCLYFSWR
jgi:hypothetical protein